MYHRSKFDNKQPIKEIYIIENHFEGNNNIQKIFKEMLKQKLKSIKFNNYML